MTERDVTKTFETVYPKFHAVTLTHALTGLSVRPSGYSALLLGTEGQLLSTKKLSATKESKGDSAKLARGRHSMAPFADRAYSLPVFARGAR